MRKSLLVLVGLLAIVLVGFQVIGQCSTVEAMVDIKPDTLNVNMQGRWITTYITLPEGFNASDIDISTVLLEQLFQAQWSEIEGKVLMVKFDAAAVTGYLLAKLYHLGASRAQVDLIVEGKLMDGTAFVGSDMVTVIYPQMEH